MVSLSHLKLDCISYQNISIYRTMYHKNSGNYVKYIKPIYFTRSRFKLFKSEITCKDTYNDIHRILFRDKN